MKFLKKSKGITLLSLVITIIVLSLLTGITITATIGENGIIRTIYQAKKEASIIIYKEKLLTIVVNEQVNPSQGNTDSNIKNVRERLEEEKNSGREDWIELIECGGDGKTIIVISKEQYVFHVIIEPSEHNVEFVGEIGRLAPRIQQVSTISTTSDILVSVKVTNLSDGDITYSYSEEEHGIYQEIITTKNLTHQMTNMKPNTTYYIKVEAQNSHGKYSKVISCTTERGLI